VEAELQKSKAQAAELIEQANKRANQIVDEAKTAAHTEGDRIKAAAAAEVEQEVNRAKEALRAQVAALAVAGAEKILGASVDVNNHQELVDKLAAEL
jgi:F-type H+-transporting ATPase subunit b